MWESFASMWEKPGVFPHTTHGWLVAVTLIISYYATVKQNERITTYRELSINVRKLFSLLPSLSLSLSLSTFHFVTHCTLVKFKYNSLLYFVKL